MMIIDGLYVVNSIEVCIRWCMFGDRLIVQVDGCKEQLLLVIRDRCL